MLNLTNIHIGSLIEIKWKEMDIGTERTCKFLRCTEQELYGMLAARSLDSEILLRWSKLLQYDFFRFYSQHLILYAPQGNTKDKIARTGKSSLPQFRKNIYTKQIIDFVLEVITSGEKTKKQVIEEYNIPKTTLYKWIVKYSLPKES